jgi:hypothetical protein
MIMLLSSIATWQIGTINVSVMNKHTEIEYFIPVQTYETMTIVGASGTMIMLAVLTVAAIQKKM